MFIRDSIEFQKKMDEMAALPAKIALRAHGISTMQGLLFVAASMVGKMLLDYLVEEGEKS